MLSGARFVVHYLNLAAMILFAICCGVVYFFDRSLRWLANHPGFLRDSRPLHEVHFGNGHWEFWSWVLSELAWHSSS